MEHSPETPLNRHVQEMVSGAASLPPVAKLIGFRFVSAAAGRAVVELETDERHTNPMGTVHGGILSDIADAAMGAAFSTTVPAGSTFTTLELKINFLRPVWKTTLAAEGEVIKTGKSIGLTACNVYDANRNLVAHATSTLMVLTGEQAKGRQIR